MYRVLALFLVLNLLIIGCKPESKGYDKNPIKFKVDKKYSQKEVSEFVSKALLRLGWSIKDIKADSVSAGLNHRGWIAKTTINISNQNEIVILSDSVLKIERASGTLSGPPVVEYQKRVPFNWLMNIKKFTLEEAKIKGDIQTLQAK